jgi:hypothetical protein
MGKEKRNQMGLKPAVTFSPLNGPFYYFLLFLNFLFILLHYCSRLVKSHRLALSSISNLGANHV